MDSLFITISATITTHPSTRHELSPNHELPSAKHWTGKSQSSILVSFGSLPLLRSSITALTATLDSICILHVGRLHQYRDEVRMARSSVIDVRAVSRVSHTYPLLPPNPSILACGAIVLNFSQSQKISTCRQPAAISTVLTILLSKQTPVSFGITYSISCFSTGFDSRERDLPPKMSPRNRKRGVLLKISS